MKLNDEYWTTVAGGGTKLSNKAGLLNNGQHEPSHDPGTGFVSDKMLHLCYKVPISAVGHSSPSTNLVTSCLWGTSAAQQAVRAI